MNYFISNECYDLDGKNISWNIRNVIYPFIIQMKNVELKRHEYLI